MFKPTLESVEKIMNISTEAIRGPIEKDVEAEVSKFLEKNAAAKKIIDKAVEKAVAIILEASVDVAQTVNQTDINIQADFDLVLDATESLATQKILTEITQNL